MLVPTTREVPSVRSAVALPAAINTAAPVSGRTIFWFTARPEMKALPPPPMTAARASFHPGNGARLIVRRRGAAAAGAALRRPCLFLFLFFAMGPLLAALRGIAERR